MAERSRNLVVMSRVWLYIQRADCARFLYILQESGCLDGTGKRVIKPVYLPVLTHTGLPAHPAGHGKCIAPINYSQSLHYQDTEG